MKIDQLPIEMLMKIFSYLSRFEEVSLVNKWFYSVACKVNDPNICLRLDDRFFKGKWMSSVQKSTRQVSKLYIYLCLPDEATCRSMISIIAKFGASITYLSITQTRVTISEFLEILELVPNVKHLIIEGLELRDKEVLERLKSSDNDLNLDQLKKLRFRGSNIVGRDEFLAVFDRLPVGVLTELELICFKLNAVVDLFKRQTNITKLEVTGFVFKASEPVDIFDNLQLKSIAFSSYSSRLTTIFLSKQTQLKSLTIPYLDANEDFLNFVANHTTQLETLSIYITAIPSASCKENISKMKSLKSLSVWIDEGTPTNQLESLLEFPYLGITSLALHHNFLNVSLVQALAMSLTKLKALRLFCYNDCAAIINAIMTNFNFVEVLHITGNIDGCYQLNDGDRFNPKLTELMAPLPRSISSMYINKLIADYPNLKKFQINWDLITSSQFRQVLNGFTKLESLTFIGSGDWLTVDDLNYLKDHKNNLKFVSLGALNIRYTDQLKRHLSAAFGVIICNDYHECIMAVDRHTINRERRSTRKGVVNFPFN